MITAEQIREKYIVKAEKNGKNDNIATDRGRICILYNESKNKFLTLHLQNRGIDDVRYIQNFLVLDKKIPYSSKTQDKYNFKLPENYFDLSSARVKAKKGNCSRLLNLVEVKTENLIDKLQDEFNKPSFEWEESLYTVNSNSISIYTDGSFKTEELLLNYYRYPQDLKLLNPENPESNFDDSIEIEWDDKALDDIITMMVFNNDINENNPRFQLQTLRLQK